MSISGRRMPSTAIAGFALLMVLLALLPAVSATPPREIRLVVQGMAFYLKNDLETPNPTLTVKAGERVRVIVENQERGITHDFAVPRLGAALDPLQWSHSGTVTINIPRKPGTYEYVCRPHQLMMRGTIQVS